jgi:hypothetical protein
MPISRRMVLFGSTAAINLACWDFSCWNPARPALAASQFALPSAGGDSDDVPTAQFALPNLAGDYNATASSGAGAGSGSLMMLGVGQ